MNDSRPPFYMRPGLLIVAAAVVALVGGIMLASLLLAPRGTAPDIERATYLPGGKPIPEFELVDHNSQRFDKSSLDGRWTFVFFGYTFCPDICPATMMIMAQVEDGIRERDPDAPVQTVFVSVDPQRDTPARLAQYVPYFNPNFIGVSGAEPGLSHFARSLGSVYVTHEREGGNYLVDHSSAVLLLNPAGQLQAVFSAPHEPASILRDFTAIRDFYRPGR